jgi:hypothetical protein
MVTTPAQKSLDETRKKVTEEETKPIDATAMSGGIVSKPTVDPVADQAARMKVSQERLMSSVKDQVNSPYSYQYEIPANVDKYLTPGPGAPSLNMPDKSQWIYPFDGRFEAKMHRQRQEALINGRPDPMQPSWSDKAATATLSAINSGGKAVTTPIMNVGKDYSSNAIDVYKPLADSAIQSAGGTPSPLPPVAAPAAGATTSANQSEPQKATPAQAPTEAAAAQPKMYAPGVTQQALEMLKWRTAYGMNHGQDPKALQNEYLRGMSAINEMQGAFKQREDSDNARRAGIVQRDPMGRDVTFPIDKNGNIIAPKAGDVSDGSGRPVTLEQGLDRVERNLDGTTTIRTASGGTVRMGKTSEPPLRSVFDTRSEAMAALGGTDPFTGIRATRPAGSRIEGVPGQQFLEENANRIAKESGPIAGSPNANIQKEINDRITQTPDLTQALTELNRSGAINKNTPIEVIEKKVAEYNRTKEPSFGDLLTKLDAAAARPGFNRVPVTSGGDTANAGEYTSSTPQNVAATPEGIANYNKERGAERQALAALAERGESPYGIPTQEQFMADAGTMADEMRNSPVAQDEQRRWAQYAAKQAMERASADRPSGDPLRDAQIAVNQAEAAKQMAMADGATKEQIQENPGMVSRYLTNPNGINALGSTAKTNQLAMEHLRGADMRDLVKNAVDRNIGRSQVSDLQNKQAIDQNSKQAAISEQGDKAADREAALKQQAQIALERREDKATQTRNDRVKGLEGRLDRIDKEIAENEKDSGDVGKKAGALRNLDVLRKKKAKIQADLDEALGLEPEKVDSETAAGDITPQPNQLPEVKTKEEVDKLPPGASFTMKGVKYTKPQT